MQSCFFGISMFLVGGGEIDSLFWPSFFVWKGGGVIKSGK